MTDPLTPEAEQNLRAYWASSAAHTTVLPPEDMAAEVQSLLATIDALRAERAEIAEVLGLKPPATAILPVIRVLIATNRDLRRRLDRPQHHHLRRLLVTPPQMPLSPEPPEPPIHVMSQPSLVEPLGAGPIKPKKP